MADEITESITITLPEDSAAPTETTVVVQPETTPLVEKTEQTPAVLTDSPQDALNALKQQLAQRETELSAARDLANRETSARQGFERMARDNAGRAEQFRSQASEASYESVVSALSSAQTQQEHIQQQISEAMEKGDFPLAGKLTTEAAKVGAKLVNLEDSKARIESERASPPVQQVEQQPSRVQETLDQFFTRTWNQAEFDSYINSRTPATAAWLRSNTRFAGDPNFRQKVAAAHQFLTTVRGISPDTPEYFQSVEEAVGTRQPGVSSVTKTDPVSMAAQPVATAPARTLAPAAPPSRNVPTSGRANPTQITLSPEQRAIARQLLAHVVKDGKDPEVVYAQQLAAATADGSMNKFTH